MRRDQGAHARQQIPGRLLVGADAPGAEQAAEFVANLHELAELIVVHREIESS